VRRRAVLRALAAAPLALDAAAAEAKDYALPEEVFDDIGRLEADVDGRLAGFPAKVPGSAPFVASVRSVHARHAGERAALARRLGLRVGPPAPRPAAADLSLAALREAQQALVHAHAEGLPAIRDAAGVDLLARHMVEESRHLTVIDLWIEGEERRG
jgi:hypothetical protein